MSNASKIFLLIIFLGMLFRMYQPLTRLNYGHDADLASWVIKDIVFDHHPRLIGQLTSAPGVFIGSLTYYSQIPAYWLAQWDPAGTLVWNWGLAFASLVSIFWVSYKLYGKKAALVTALMFAVSFDIAQTERVAVPTALVFVWATWFYYFLYKLFRGESKSLYGLAVLFALVWHISLALGLLFPLVLICMGLNIKKMQIKHMLGSLVLGLVLISPLLGFEMKHNFQQVRAVIASGHTAFTTTKLVHTLSYAARNMNEAYWKRPDKVSVWLLPMLFLVSLGTLVWKKVYSKTWLVILLIWAAVVIGFFTVNALNLSEYYLHGFSIIWIMTFGLVLSRLSPKLEIVVLALLIVINLFRLFSFAPNHEGYVERKEITQYIAADAKAHNYPCIAISYMTDPGNNLGYRYFFYRLGLAVNEPSSLAPVYTIVFPHTRADHLDKTFGSLGLVKPDYSRYTANGIKSSCLGRNDNLTGSMFGFTK